MIVLAFDTWAQFIIHDIFGNILHYTLQTIYIILLLPTAAIGLFFEQVRKLKQKCKGKKEKPSPFARLTPPAP
jgi:hypothetical protein